jgi:farnesyl diphosphate synthase
MDNGETRRGKPCWFRDSKVGFANAINDGLLLEQVLYELVEMHEKTRLIASRAHRILRDASMRTVLGQHLDTCPPTDPRDFTREQWLSVVRFKTAFYTFFLPCELGILVTGTEYSNEDLRRLREVCLLLGELFQAQDDMLDCFADPSVIGKIGRDIEEGKCTWLWYTALELTEDSPQTRADLIELFSSPARGGDVNVVSRIKDIYREIGIQEEFERFQKALTLDINEKISLIQASGLQSLCKWLLQSTMNRKK